LPMPRFDVSEKSILKYHILEVCHLILSVCPKSGWSPHWAFRLTGIQRWVGQRRGRTIDRQRRRTRVKLNPKRHPPSTVPGFRCPFR
jgi:hypothetical protein